MASIRRDDDGPVYLVAKASAVTSASCISCFGEEVVAGGGGRGGGSPPAATFSSAGDDAGVLRCVRPIRCAHSWPRRNAVIAAVIAGHDRRQQRLQISLPTPDPRFFSSSGTSSGTSSARHRSGDAEGRSFSSVVLRH